jgi:hypothetical protein
LDWASIAERFSKYADEVKVEERVLEENTWNNCRYFSYLLIKHLVFIVGRFIPPPSTSSNALSDFLLPIS